MIRRLERTDKREGFESGHERLDEFFRKFARQHQDRHLSTTYVVDDGGVIIGFVTVVSSELEPMMVSEEGRKRWPRGRVPVLRLARMAVAKSRQGEGIGKRLLKYVFMLAREQANRTGCVGVVVDAKPGAVSFHESYGFEVLHLVEGEVPGEPAPTPMYLEIGAIPSGPVDG